MALTYTTFTTFPLEITGIDGEYNGKITAIENFVVADLAYSGDTSDVESILPYFVYFYLLDNRTTDRTTKTGETMPIYKESEQSFITKNFNWNIGANLLRAVFGITDTKLNELNELNGMTNAEKLHVLVEATGKTVNEKYLSRRSAL